MDGIGNASGKITASSSNLIFLYEPVHKKILFSTLSPHIFFDHPVDLTDDLPFRNITRTDDAKDMKAAWTSALQLNEKQTRDFCYPLKQANGQYVPFHFNATAISSGDENKTRGILFSVTRLDSIRPGHGREHNTKEYAEFIDLAAHDLDAPLRKLSLFFERLTSKDDLTSEEARQYSQRINASLKAMRTMIDNLALLSKLGHEKPQIVSCDMDKLAREAMQELRELIAEKKADVRLSALPVVQGDAAQYRLLFKCLLENSLRFAHHDRTPEITVEGETAGREEKEKWDIPAFRDYFRITIADNGIGFSEENAEKIFKPFIRLHGKSEYPGTGLGLTISKKITENHEGVIYAESTGNSGSRFVLLLPQTLH